MMYLAMVSVGSSFYLNQAASISRTPLLFSSKWAIF